jgi:nitrogen fixation protein NifU and related proteins
MVTGFTKEALRRFKNPKNTGELKNYNALGEAGNPECSDVIRLFIRFNNNKVINAKFQVYGCPGAISTTDVFIDMIKGEIIENILKISEEQISDALNGLPLSHKHCSKLPMKAFRNAIKNYNGK